MNETSTAKTVRRYSQEFKTLVLTECNQTGAVIKAVAQKHGVPISLVHKWRYKAKSRTAIPAAKPHAERALAQSRIGDFVALPMPAAKRTIPTSQPTSQAMPLEAIRIDLTGTTLSACVHWPLSAISTLSSSAQCAVWLRELLR